MKHMFSALIALALTQLVAAQIFPGNFSSRSVATGERAQTAVDTFMVETNVGCGIATTRITFVLTPQAYYSYQRTNEDTLVCYDYINEKNDTTQSCYRGSKLSWDDPVAMDSVEISGWFTLPADFVATSMQLWVNGEPQEAYIQDRTLAWEQYSDIVGVRRDPALLEFHGNGSYSLRIFPAASFEARKIAITFQHTFDDDSASMITASVPVAHESYRGWYMPPDIPETISYARATLTAADSRRYYFSMPGLGAGRFSRGRPVTITAESIDTLSSGTIMALDPSGPGEFIWQSVDKDNQRVAGFAVALAESTVALEPEPENRTIIIDVRDSLWSWNDYYRESCFFRDGEYPSHQRYGENDTANLWNRARK